MYFNNLCHKHGLKKKATSNTKNQNTFSYVSLSDVKRNLRDEPFSIDVGIVNLHPTKRTNWVIYRNENFFD